MASDLNKDVELENSTVAETEAEAEEISQEVENEAGEATEAAEVEEIDRIKRNAEVWPVDTDYIDCLLRDLQGLQDLEGIVSAGSQSVRKVLLHILGIIRGAVIHVYFGCPDLEEQIEEFLHGFP